MKNDEMTKLMKDFFPVARDMADALLCCTDERKRRIANERIHEKRGYLRLTSDIRGDGLQRVLLQLIHSGEVKATLALMKVGPDMRVTEVSIGQIGSRSELEATLARYVPPSKYVAAYLLVSAEDREAAMTAHADNFVSEDEARYRLQTDILPEGPVLSLTVASCGPNQTLDHPVTLIACGAPGLIEKTKPTPEQIERAAWFFNTMPQRH